MLESRLCKTSAYDLTLPWEAYEVNGLLPPRRQLWQTAHFCGIQEKGKQMLTFACEENVWGQREPYSSLASLTMVSPYFWFCL